MWWRRTCHFDDFQVSGHVVDGFDSGTIKTAGAIHCFRKTEKMGEYTLLAGRTPI